MPADYESQRHRGFAFIEYEQSEDAAAAIDNMVGEIKQDDTYIDVLQSSDTTYTFRTTRSSVAAQSA